MRRILVLGGAVVVFLLMLQAFMLHLFGQPAICPCGTVKWWEGLTSHSSLDITDWYTFSHVIHGFIFYMALRYIFPRLSFVQRLVIAVAIEAGWEIAENLPAVIEHYRQQALSAQYTGDSILNSVSDTIAMMIGFLFASRAPVWATIFTALGFEIFIGYSIRDNLTLNVLGFFYQFDAISTWQRGS